MSPNRGVKAFEIARSVSSEHDTASVEAYRSLNADFGAEFDLFAMTNPDWMTTNVPPGAIIVMQTEDTGFNAWARESAERNRLLDKPPRPVVLVHIKELRPAQSRIVRAEAELLHA